MPSDRDGLAPYITPQLWSRAIHDHPADFDGIAYYSRHDNSPLCFALFERSRAKVYPQNIVLDLDNDWIVDLLDAYQIGLLPF